MIGEATCVVLVGGQSRRMGSDKASSTACGVSLLERVLDVVVPLFDEVLIGAHEEGLYGDKVRRGARVVIDSLPGRGPALGVSKALGEAKNPWVFVVSCDVPLLRPALVERLATFREGSDAVVPEAGGRAQTMCAFYSKNCLALLTRRIEEGRRGLTAFLKEPSLSVRFVTEAELKGADPALYSFMDVDTPGELERMEALIKEKSL